MNHDSLAVMETIAGFKWPKPPSGGGDPETRGEGGSGGKITFYVTGPPEQYVLISWGL